MNEQPEYAIVVRGELSRRWRDWFDELEVTPSHTTDGVTTTTLRGPIVDQAALRGILCTLWDLNLTLISVHCITGHDRQREKSNDDRL